MIRSVLALALLTDQAAAQDIAFTPAATEACLASDAAPETCIGQSSALCMQDSEGGETTIGMSFCAWAEAEYWDARLNAAYKALMAAHKASDAEDATYGLDVPSRADALREMQRAWIPYRDAACAYERAQWGGGTGQGPAGAACVLHLTGEQALELEAALAEAGR